MKIIIIGAGVAGLTLAVACQQAGMDVHLFDKSKQLHNIGGGILLWPHGQRYLDWLGLGDVLSSLKHDISACNILGSKGNILLHEKCDALFSVLGGSILPVSRNDFQQALVQCLEEDTLQLNKELSHVSHEKNQVTAIFSDGSQQTADIIVGADGIHSAVRNYINKNVSLNYTGFCWYGGITPQHDAIQLKQNESYLYSAVSKLCIIWPTSNNQFMWYLPIKMPLSEFAIKDQSKLNAALENWLPEVAGMTSVTLPGNSFYVPIYAVPPQDKITKDRVVLIGDAAHAIGPILGQGASQAIEDAYALFSCLTSIHVDMPTVLAYYQTLRIEKYKRLAAIENKTADVLVCDDSATQLAFEEQAPHMQLSDMYEELIPLVDEEASLELAKATTEIIYEAIPSA